MKITRDQKMRHFYCFETISKPWLHYAFYWYFLMQYNNGPKVLIYNWYNIIDNRNIAILYAKWLMYGNLYFGFHIIRYLHFTSRYWALLSSSPTWLDATHVYKPAWWRLTFWSTKVWLPIMMPLDLFSTKNFPYKKQRVKI